MSTAPSTPKAAAAGPANQLTARELEIMGYAWSCLKSGAPEIDYEQLALKLNMANPRSAANAWGIIKKKMGSTWATTATPKSAAAKAGAAKSGGPSAVKSGGSSSKRKAAAPLAKTAMSGSGNVSDDGEDELVSPTPVKKQRTAAKPRATPKGKGKGKKVAVRAPADGDDEDDEDYGPKVPIVKPVPEREEVDPEITVKAEDRDGSDDYAV